MNPYALTPYIEECLADLETPLSLYLKLAQGPYSYLLESVQGDERWGRYSFIGLPSSLIITVHGKEIRIFDQGVCIEHTSHAEPLAWLKSFQKRFHVPPQAPFSPFYGGWVGYFGYDLVRSFEPLLLPTEPSDDPLKIPDAVWIVSKEVIILDKLTGKIWFVVMAVDGDSQSKQAAQEKLKALKQGLHQPLKEPFLHYPFRQKETLSLMALTEKFRPEFNEAAFEKAVTRIKQYILDGETMQVVLSQRSQAPFLDSPISYYRALRHLNPSPYHFYLNLKDFHIVGASPEILVRKEGKELTVRPIAGTRRRGKTDDEDHRLEEELKSDPKERSEHLMLIDLGRNDIGRVAAVGSVHVSRCMDLERYSHVMHLVSEVHGKLKEGLTALDAFKATFPAGTVTGAPKIRAMQVIDELEPSKRGAYAGAIGYLSWQDDMDMAIAIRTAIIKQDTIYLQAGAGIVADSIPREEWKESLNKSHVLMQAIHILD
ncbi:MAG: anthranilate synthase component I [Gammaproteobacteria bacterium]|nr:anthranilate synthase component I [Gammaproteobacteria bacterium]